MTFLHPCTQRPPRGRAITAAVLHGVGLPWLSIPSGLGYFVLGAPGKAVTWMFLSFSRLLVLAFLFLAMGDDAPGPYGDYFLPALLGLQVMVWIEGIAYPVWAVSRA